MNFLLNCIQGIAIGAGAILPGISSGVLCVIFGIYEKLLDSILGFFKDIKGNLKFLFPLVIGGGIGVLLFSNLLNYFLVFFPIQTKSIFIGLILGSIPSLIKEGNQKESFQIKNLFYLLAAFLIGLVTVILENNLSIASTNSTSFSYLFLSGFLMSVGIVVPGVSSTIILMLLGIYSTYLVSVSSLFLPVLIPMGLGLLLGGLIFMKLTKFLLDSYYAQTFYTIIGFTFGSIFVLIPQVGFNLDGLISILCVLFGYVLFCMVKH